MKKNCIIIHGCPSDKESAMDPETRTYDKHWLPWTKEKLTQRGIDTSTPLMPEPWEPVYEKFKKELEKNQINENTILVGTRYKLRNGFFGEVAGRYKATNCQTYTGSAVVHNR